MRSNSKRLSVLELSASYRPIKSRTCWTFAFFVEYLLSARPICRGPASGTPFVPPPITGENGEGLSVSRSLDSHESTLQSDRSAPITLQGGHPESTG